MGVRLGGPFGSGQCPSSPSGLKGEVGRPVVDALHVLLPNQVAKGIVN